MTCCLLSAPLPKHPTMSTTSTSDDPDLESTSSSSSDRTSTSLNYTVTHVFLPVQLPDKNDYTLEDDHSLARSVCAAAHAYGTHICGTSEQAQWHRTTRMLDNLQVIVQSLAEHMDNDYVIESQLLGMQTGGTFARPHRSRAVPIISRYPRVFRPTSKCRDCPHEAGELYAVRGFRGVPKQI